MSLRSHSITPAAIDNHSGPGGVCGLAPRPVYGEWSRPVRGALAADRRVHNRVQRPAEIIPSRCDIRPADLTAPIDEGISVNLLMHRSAGVMQAKIEGVRGASR